MSGTAESPTARRLPRRASNASRTPFNQPSLISEHGKLPGFSCVASAEGRSVTRILVTGELDIATTPQLAAALSSPANGSGLVILDLRQVTFIDATGLALILGAASRLRSADRRLALIPGPRSVQRLFEMTRTDRQLDFLTAPDANRLSSNGDLQTSRGTLH